MRYILVVLFFIYVWGCYGCKTKQWAVSKLAQIEHHQPQVLANKCADKYPPKDSIHRETIYIPGKNTTTPGETKYVNCDSGKNKGNARVAVPCPPSTHRVDTVRDNNTVYLVNRAKEQAQEMEIAKLQQENAALKTDKEWMKIWAIGASVLFILAGILLLIKIR